MGCWPAFRLSELKGTAEILYSNSSFSSVGKSRGRKRKWFPKIMQLGELGCTYSYNQLCMTHFCKILYWSVLQIKLINISWLPTVCQTSRDVHRCGGHDLCSSNSLQLIKLYEWWFPVRDSFQVCNCKGPIKWPFHIKNHSLTDDWWFLCTAS